MAFQLITDQPRLIEQVIRGTQSYVLIKAFAAHPLAEHATNQCHLLTGSDVAGEIDAELTPALSPEHGDLACQFAVNVDPGSVLCPAYLKPDLLAAPLRRHFDLGAIPQEMLGPPASVNLAVPAWFNQAVVPVGIFIFRQGLRGGSAQAEFFTAWHFAPLPQGQRYTLSLPVEQDRPNQAAAVIPCHPGIPALGLDTNQERVQHAGLNKPGYLQFQVLVPTAGISAIDVDGRIVLVAGQQ